MGNNDNKKKNNRRSPMVKRVIIIGCPKCGSEDVSKNGHNRGTQRYVCKRCGVTFSEKPKKFNREVKKQAIEMVLNGVGIRKTARFVKSSPTSVINWLKAAHKLLKAVKEVAKPMEKPDIIEFDEIYTYVKKNDSKQ
jgi:transposase-like protein